MPAVVMTTALVPRKDPAEYWMTDSVPAALPAECPGSVGSLGDWKPVAAVGSYVAPP